MKIRIPGESTKVSCQKCQAFREATWQYGPLTMNDGTVIDEVLQAYCGTCGEPCSMAHQSAWKLRQAREAREKTRTSVVLSLPLFDLTASKVSELGGEGRRGPELLASAVLRRLTREPAAIPRFAKSLMALESPLLKRPTRKMNLSLPSSHSKVLEQLKSATSLNQSEVIRRSLVLSESDPEVLKELRALFEPRPQDHQ